MALVDGIEIAKDTQTGGNSPYFLCFSCGYRAAGRDLIACSRCGEWTENDFAMCDDCVDDAISRD